MDSLSKVRGFKCSHWGRENREESFAHLNLVHSSAAGSTERGPRRDSRQRRQPSAAASLSGLAFTYTQIDPFDQVVFVQAVYLVRLSRHDSWMFLAQFYKTFYGLNLLMFIISQSVFPSRPFQHSLMFVGKARSLSQSRAPERQSNRVGSGLTHKQQTRLERLAGTNTLAYYEDS